MESSKVYHLNGLIFYLVWKLLMFRSNLEVYSDIFLYFLSVLLTNFHPLYTLSMDICIFLIGNNSIKNHSSSSAATITNIKVIFSVVCLSGTMILTGKLSFVLFPYYPNQCRLLGGNTLDRLLAKPVYLKRLLEYGFY